MLCRASLPHPHRNHHCSALGLALKEYLRSLMLASERIDAKISAQQRFDEAKASAIRCVIDRAQMAPATPVFSRQVVLKHSRNS